MSKVPNPPWWLTLLTAIAGIGGVATPGIDDPLKAVIVAVAGLVIAVYQVQHHRTVRNADVAAATAVRPVLDLDALAGQVAQLVAAHIYSIAQAAQVPPPAPPTVVVPPTSPSPPEAPQGAVVAGTATGAPAP